MVGGRHPAADGTGMVVVGVGGCVGGSLGMGSGSEGREGMRGGGHVQARAGRVRRSGFIGRGTEGHSSQQEERDRWLLDSCWVAACQSSCIMRGNQVFLCLFCVTSWLGA